MVQDCEVALSLLHRLVFFLAMMLVVAADSLLPALSLFLPGLLM